MQIILTKQVPKLGNPGDIVDVSAGYARNFLIPKGLAREATNQAIKEAQQSRKKKTVQKERVEKKKTKMHNILEGQVILVRASANEEGHLFGGVGASEITAAVAKRKKVEIDPKKINLPHRLKTLGKHDVVLQLGGGDEVGFVVDVQPADIK